MSGVYKHPRTMDFIVACDPRCKMEREGSVALVYLREKAVCDLANIVRVLGLLARGVYMMCFVTVSAGLVPRTVKLLGGGVSAVG